MIQNFLDQLNDFLIANWGLSSQTAAYLDNIILLLGLAVFCFMVWFFSKRILHNVIPKITSKTKTIWDDIIFSKKVINSFVHLAPALILSYYAPIILKDWSATRAILITTEVFITLVVTQILTALFNSIHEILSKDVKYQDKPIGSFTQLANILVYLVSAILIVSLIFDKSPLYLLSGLSAMAAILLLVFKDSILGLVASIQLSANDMIRIGDWVTVNKYGADGDVVAINLTTIKVQNFDKTITTIPTYAFISDSFTNWRGMQNADGRRIKRALHIQINTIHFCSNQLLERLNKLQLLNPTIEAKKSEIASYNANIKANKDLSANGRHLTNIGLFRVYVEKYLQNHPSINQNMTCMVRQLAPTAQGVPIELYCFSSVKDWVLYENIIADIFDHLMACAETFELKIFEQPTGHDFKQFAK